MATDLERLVVRLEAQYKSFENSMKKSGLIADQTAKKIETRFATMNKKLEGFGTGFIKGAVGGAVGALAGLFSVQAIREATKSLADLADTADRVGVGVEQLQALQQAADLAGGSAEALDNGFEKFAKNISDAGRGTGDLYKVLTANGVALRDQSGALRSSTDLFGAYADLIVRAKNPQDQLNLAVMAFGKSAGPDLLGLLREGSAGINQMTTDARQAGVVIGKDVVNAGRDLDDELVTLEKQLGTTFKEFAVQSAPLLVSGFTEINTILETINQTLNLLPKKKIDDLVEALKPYGASQVGRGLLRAASPIYGAIDAAHELTSPNNPLLADRVTSGFAAAGEAKPNASLQTALDAAAAKRSGATTKPTVVPSDSFGQKNEFDRAVASIKDRTQAIVAEANAQAKLNPLVNDYGFAVEKARAEQDLLSAAMQAGITITPQLRKQVEDLATGYAAVQVDSAKLAEQQGKLVDAVGEVADIGRSAISGLISDLRNGVSSGEAFANVLSNIADQLVNIALNSVFGGSGSGGGIGGIIGSLISAFTGGGTGGLYDSGGYTGAGGRNQPAGVVHRGEVVWSQADVARAGGVGTVEAMRKGRRGYAGGGSVGDMIGAHVLALPNAAPRARSVSPTQVTVNVDARGATSADELKEMVKQSATQAIQIAVETSRRALPKWQSDNEMYRG